MAYPTAVVEFASLAGCLLVTCKNFSEAKWAAKAELM
jgi:hypothetical protein